MLEEKEMRRGRERDFKEEWRGVWVMWERGRVGPELSGEMAEEVWSMFQAAVYRVRRYGEMRVWR